MERKPLQTLMKGSVRRHLTEIGLQLDGILQFVFSSKEPIRKYILNILHIRNLLYY